MEPVWGVDLEDLNKPEVVRQRAFRGAQTLPEMPGLSMEQQALALDSALQSIYVPTDQGCDILVRCIQRMQAFQRARYPDAKTYVGHIYGGAPQTDGGQFTCLTGLAGVGKSALMDALERVLPSTRKITPNTADSDIEIDLIRRLKVASKSTDGMVFRALANPLYAAESEKLNRSLAIEHLTQWFYNRLVLLLVIDEMQFLTQSLTANTRIAQLLMALGYPGVPVFYVANYSLVHRLAGRPQEERQRLLPDAIVLLPDGPESSSWCALLEEYVRAAPHIIRIDPVRDAATLHAYSGGLRRLLRQLFVKTLQYENPSCDGRITMARIGELYASHHYVNQRMDVEAMASLSMSPLLAASRRDLVCPFGDQADKHTSKRQRTTQTVTTPTRAALHMLESTLSPTARDTLKDLRAGGQAVADKTRAKASVQPLRRKGAVTADDLLAGAKAVRAMIDGKTPNAPEPPGPENKDG